MKNTMIYYFFSYFTVSTVLALLLVPFARSLSFRVGALDRGAGRRIHTGVVPRLGGIGVFVSFVVPMIFSLTRGQWDIFHHNMAGILAASVVVLLIGTYDDTKGARIINKLGAEILAASIIYFWGIRITTVSNPFGGAIDLGWLSLPVTILWIIVITNAINLIDGLDGLAAGTGIFIATTLLLISGNDIHLQLTYVILIGSLIGFLRYNFPPASIFMGDSGSLFLGFFLGSTSILSSHKATAIVTVMIPIIAFSFPLMDMVYAVLRRYYRGIYLGEPDREHIHHKLLEKGMSKKKVLVLLYIINISIMLLVLLLVRRQLNIDFLGLALLVIAAVLGLRMLGYIEFMPLIREMISNYDIGRRRKYFHYVIKRFRRDASKSRDMDEFRSHMTSLMQEYHFTSVEIILDIPNTANPFYVFPNSNEPEKPISLSFPIVVDRDNNLGRIILKKQMDDDHVVCVSEMVKALSEEVGRFIKSKDLIKAG